jgi:hypothetical protein
MSVMHCVFVVFMGKYLNKTIDHRHTFESDLASFSHAMDKRRLVLFSTINDHDKVTQESGNAVTLNFCAFKAFLEHTNHNYFLNPQTWQHF